MKVDWADFKRVSVIVLMLANLVPVFGVVFMGWQVFPIMFLFWTENLIIGAFNVLKMALSAKDNSGRPGSKAAAISFFCVHYGLFALVHGIFVFVIFGGLIEQDDLNAGVSATFNTLGNLQFGWAVLALIISHAVSFVVNYIGKGENRNSSLAQLMGEPYGRVVIMHITILFGGFLVILTGSSAIGLILLIVLKTFVDIKGHLRLHGPYGSYNGDAMAAVNAKGGHA